ncbi:MAG: glycosyl hydrolase 108 family protein [Dictyoglomaceae bacterium]
MVKDNFEKAVNFVLKWEGNYSNDKDDYGGETKYGISKRSYPDLDIKNLTIEKAKEIYRKNYWEKMKCDNLPYPMDIIVFDTSVNMGISTAQELLKKSNNDPKEFMILRIKKYKEIITKNKKLEKFFIGWINRVIDLYLFTGGNK